jgi:hypothetical protein
MCATPTATSSVSAERSARPADPSSPTAAVRAALPFHLRAPSTSPCARQEDLAAPRGGFQDVSGTVRDTTPVAARIAPSPGRRAIYAVTYAATLGGHQAATPAFATERACRASTVATLALTMSMSAGRDCCSPTNPAVRGRLIEAPVAIELDESEQRPERDAGRSAAATGVATRVLSVAEVHQRLALSDDRPRGAQARRPPRRAPPAWPAAARQAAGDRLRALERWQRALIIMQLAHPP